jgi:hypothetical protein
VFCTRDAAGRDCKTIASGRESWFNDGLVAGALQLTARQYGEVVLPDESTGQSPDTLARKLSRCKEGMAHFLPSGYKFY